MEEQAEYQTKKNHYFRKENIPENWWLMEHIDESGLMVKKICSVTKLNQRDFYKYIAHPNLLTVEEVYRLADVLRLDPKKLFSEILENWDEKDIKEPNKK